LIPHELFLILVHITVPDGITDTNELGKVVTLQHPFLKKKKKKKKKKKEEEEEEEEEEETITHFSKDTPQAQYYYTLQWPLTGGSSPRLNLTGMRKERIIWLCLTVAPLQYLRALLRDSSAPEMLASNKKSRPRKKYHVTTSP